MVMPMVVLFVSLAAAPAAEDLYVSALIHRDAAKALRLVRAERLPPQVVVQPRHLALLFEVWYWDQPSEINLLDVIEALDGPIRLNRCVIEPDNCPHEGKCPVHDIWIEAQRDLTRVLTSVTFDSLAEQGRETGLLPLPIPPDP